MLLFLFLQFIQKGNDDLIACAQVRRMRCYNSLRQMGGQILFVQSLATELIELDLIGEVTTYNILNMLANGRLKVVLVDLGQVFGAICEEFRMN